VWHESSYNLPRKSPIKKGEESELFPLLTIAAAVDVCPAVLSIEEGKGKKKPFPCNILRRPVKKEKEKKRM
jgi:hypothetical protein